MPATIGLCGLGESGGPLQVQVYRGGHWLNRSPASPVKLVRTQHDAKQNLQEFTLTVLREDDFLLGVNASGDPRTRPLTVYELSNTPSGVIRDAASKSEHLRGSVRG